MRKTKEVVITAEGRDKGKTFELTEMPARQAEAWAMRALGAMARSGMDVPTEGGMAAFAVAGFKAFLAAPWTDIEPLLDELMACVQIKMPAGVRALVEDDTEEVTTLVRLRDEVIELHLGFSLAAAMSAAVAVANPTPDTSITPISPEPSEPSSLAA